MPIDKRSAAHFSPLSDNGGKRQAPADLPISAVSDQLMAIGQQMDNISGDDNNAMLMKQLFQMCVSLLQCVHQQNDELVRLKQRQMVDDAIQDHERRRSVVVLGLPESPKERPSERVAADQTAISNVLDELGIESPVTIYRMGSSDQAKSGRPRLMKIVFPCTKYQRQALGQWTKLRDTIKEKTGWNYLKIRPSLSREELDARRLLQEQCTKKRQEDGGQWVVYAERVMLRSDISAFKKNNK